MKTFFINTKEKKITEILLTKESESTIYFPQLWDKIRLVLNSEFVDGIPYDDDSYLFFKDQFKPSESRKYWVKIEGDTETKIIFGNSLLIYPDREPNGERINQGGLVEGSSLRITFLDDYKIPVQDFEL